MSLGTSQNYTSHENKTLVSRTGKYLHSKFENTYLAKNLDINHNFKFSPIALK